MAKTKMITRWRNKSKRKEEIEKLIKPNTIMTIFDTETTGLTNTSKIIQFSGIKYKFNETLDMQKVEEMDIYINPEELLDKKITKITGITDDMLNTQNNEKYYAPIIFEFLSDSDVVCGYNVPFDIHMLHLMAERTNNCYDDLPYLDVLEMAKDWVFKDELEKHNLGSVASYLHPEENFQFHSSIEDVKATAILFNDFYKMYQTFEDNQQEKEYMHLERACLVINPRKKSEQRIKLKLNAGELGDIFWDVKNQEWGCCQNTRAKQYFNNTNLANLEEQFLNMYGYRFGYSSPKEVAKSWMEFRKLKLKERKEQQKG